MDQPRPVCPRVQFLFEPLDVLGDLVDQVNHYVDHFSQGQAMQPWDRVTESVITHRLDTLMLHHGRWVRMVAEVGPRWPADDLSNRYTEAERVASAAYRFVKDRLEPLAATRDRGLIPLGVVAAYVEMIQSWSAVSGRLHQVVDFVLAGPSDPAVTATVGGEIAARTEKPKRSKKDRDATMMKMLLEEPTVRVGWPVGTWAEVLGWSTTSVHRLNTWKVIMEMRAGNKAARRAS